MLFKTNPVIIDNEKYQRGKGKPLAQRTDKTMSKSTDTKLRWNTTQNSYF